jgi:sulfate adenylyltransferase
LPELLASPERASELRTLAVDSRSWVLTPSQACDLELLLTGAFAPLTGFLNRADVDSVLSSMRLADGSLWPVPVTLDVDEALARALKPGDPLALRDAEGAPLAVLRVQDAWPVDRAAAARAVYGFDDPGHPGVAAMLAMNGLWAVGGPIEGIERPRHDDFQPLRLTPAETRARIQARGWTRTVAFQTRNPMHRAHYALTARAASSVGGGLLLHPVVGVTKPGDVDYFTRVRCYEKVLARYPEGSAMLALLPLAMRMAGPREALWHGLIRKNFGCTHLIVGRDHAGAGANREGRPYHGPYDAQNLFRQHEAELGITMVPFSEMLYDADRDAFVTETEVLPSSRVLSLSGTELRRRLQRGEDIPQWFTFPEVADELRRTSPPRARQGLTVFFTGLSGSGKSTLASGLQARLLERGRPVTMLDGDLVRRNLSSELGFSREHRDLNIRRIGFVAAEVTKHGGVAICAPIAPYDATRKEARQLVEAHGAFVLVHVSTPLEVCEARDRKGLYAKARAGLVKEFTGISDPYEPPDDAELVIDTSSLGRDAAVDELVGYLDREGFLEAGRALPLRAQP